MQVSVVNFADIDPSVMEIKPARTNKGGDGKSAYIDSKDRSVRWGWKCPELRQCWPIRPDMKVSTVEGLKPYDKFTIEMAIPPSETAFIAGLKRTDRWIHEHVLKNKEQFFTVQKASKINTIEGVELVADSGLIFRAGKAKGDGSGVYDSTVRAKIVGWAPFAESFATADRMIQGQMKTTVQDVTWKVRLISAPGPSGNDTRFWLWIADAESPGGGIFTDKVPVTDENNDLINDESGSPLFRWVGPQDASPNSQVSPILNLPSVWVSESIGGSVHATDIYIKPASVRESAPIAKSTPVADVNIDSALRAIANQRAAAVRAAAAPEDEGAAGGGASRKRKATDEPEFF